MPYTIRPASLADVPHIVHHREQMFREMGTRCDYAAMASACAAWYTTSLPGGIYRGWVAERGQDVVGGGGMIVVPRSPGPTCLDPRMAWIFNVFVEPAHRGQGVARRLMEAMHAWCRQAGVGRLALNATEPGARIYRDFGYTETPEPMMRRDL